MEHPNLPSDSREGRYASFYALPFAHCEQGVNTRRGYAPCTGRTPPPPQLGYEDKRGWVTPGFGQAPDRLRHV